MGLIQWLCAPRTTDVDRLHDAVSALPRIIVCKPETAPGDYTALYRPGDGLLEGCCTAWTTDKHVGDYVLVQDVLRVIRPQAPTGRFRRLRHAWDTWRMEMAIGFPDRRWYDR